MFIRLIMYEQDDPRKCTAAKMIRDGNAKRIKHAADATLLLNPFAKEFLLPSDKKRARSITAVDCSWRHLMMYLRDTKNKIHARCTIFSYASASLIPYCSRIIKRSSTEPSFA